jgi:hypothetical protein
MARFHSGMSSSALLWAPVFSEAAVVYEAKREAADVPSPMLTSTDLLFWKEDLRADQGSSCSELALPRLPNFFCHQFNTCRGVYRRLAILKGIGIQR